MLNLDLQLTEGELRFLKANAESIAMLNLQTELARPDTDNILAFTQYLSTSVGQKRVRQLSEEAASKVSKMTEQTTLRLGLHLNGSDRSLRGEDAFAQSLIAVLDRSIPFQKTLFSLFPADRAFPQGEQQIQLGTPDAQLHLLSHLAQPGMKYARLKQVIIQNILLSEGGRQTLTNEFNLIFDNLLPGKKLAGIEINEFGLMKVTVSDSRSGKSFDIDFMSSGEKGLLLTFLFLRLSMQEGGIVLLDEPELHLNSAVCDKIMPFLVDYCIKPLKLQAFICTHSPEIVRHAFERDDCALFHLRSGSDLTPVLPQDQGELFEIFSRLGSSPADVLFAKGGIYVEGEDDANILKAGYGDLVSGYKITALGGRGDVEREAPALQSEEAKGNLNKTQMFILDNDRKPTALRSSKLVNITQLKRYSIENYLLDEEILFDLVTAHAVVKPESRGKFPEILKSLALKQALIVAISDTYDALKPAGAGIRKEDLKSGSLDTITTILGERLSALAGQLDAFNRLTWEAEFKSKVQTRLDELTALWSSNWKELASGKTIIDDLYREFQIAMKKPEFKREVMTRMAKAETDDWRVIRDLLTSGLAS